MEDLVKEFEKSTESSAPRSINQIGGAAPPALTVAVTAPDKESYLEAVRASYLADQIKLAELEGLELKEKIRAKKADIAALQSETDTRNVEQTSTALKKRVTFDLRVEVISQPPQNQKVEEEAVYQTAYYRPIEEAFEDFTYKIFP